jgi:predicted CXXCH cytochrome family protein
MKKIYLALRFPAVLPEGVFNSLMKLFNLLTLTLALTFIPCSTFAVPTHLDKLKVSTGCRTCHKGHGTRGTTLLESPKDTLCFKCHGGTGKAKDIYSVIIKPSNHPIIQTSRYHVTGETLPERDVSSPRHASCYDCHNTHRSEKGNPVKGMKGYSGRGAKEKQIDSEYQLCYNCHSDSANLPPEKNIATAFSPFNSSYHPVETYGKNSFVPSLKKAYTASSIIKCSDCHGNDDRTGPKGPHGSIYPFILKERYDMTSGPESPSTYALCYLCHNRTSILNDESFKAHKVHIVFNQTSCSDCHDAHGSKRYQNLLTLEGQTFTGASTTASIFPNTKGELTIMPVIPGQPRCFLSCHISGRIFDHKLSGTSGSQSLQYCINLLCLPNW